MCAIQVIDDFTHNVLHLHLEDTRGDIAIGQFIGAELPYESCFCADSVNLTESKKSPDEFRDFTSGRATRPESLAAIPHPRLCRAATHLPNHRQRSTGSEEMMLMCCEISITCSIIARWNCCGR